MKIPGAFFFIPGSVFFSDAGTCITKPGHGVPNAPCVFPWKYEDDKTEYEGCANPSNSAVGLWCPTELDEEGKYVSGKWGVCADSCPGKADQLFRS